MQYSRVQRTLSSILILNLIVALAKGIFGILAGSVSMIADSIHSAFDSISNIIGIISIYLAKKPPDRDHPYGHGRYETIGTLIIGALLILSAYWIITEGIDRLVLAKSPTITGVTVAVLTGTIIINVLVARYERRMGVELGSQILIADSQHTKSDVFVSFSVLGGFFLVQIGYPQADPLLAFAIGAQIGRMGISIMREAGRVLTDATLVDCEIEIAAIVARIEEIIEYHDFRCRGKPQELFADIHISVDPGLSVKEAHTIAEDLRDAVLREIPGMKDIVVHVDPADEGSMEMAHD